LLTAGEELFVPCSPGLGSTSSYVFHFVSQLLRTLPSRCLVFQLRVWRPNPHPTRLQYMFQFAGEMC